MAIDLQLILRVPWLKGLGFKTTFSSRASRSQKVETLLGLRDLAILTFVCREHKHLSVRPVSQRCSHGVSHVAAPQSGQRCGWTSQLMPPVMSEDWDDEGSPQGELAREWDLRRDQHYNVIALYKNVVNQLPHRAGVDRSVW